MDGLHHGLGLTDQTEFHERGLYRINFCYRTKVDRMRVQKPQYGPIQAHRRSTAVMPLGTWEVMQRWVIYPRWVAHRAVSNQVSP